MRAVAAFGLLPIPGPVDEIVLVLIAPVLLLYRQPIREAWAKSLSQDPPRTLGPETGSNAALPASAEED